MSYVACICTHVCMYACMLYACACMHVWKHACECICMYVVCMYLQACMHVSMHAYVSVCLVLLVFARMYVCMHACILYVFAPCMHACNLVHTTATNKQKRQCLKSVVLAHLGAQKGGPRGAKAPKGGCGEPPKGQAPHSSLGFRASTFLARRTYPDKEVPPYVLVSRNNTGGHNRTDIATLQSDGSKDTRIQQLAAKLSKGRSYVGFV